MKYLFLLLICVYCCLFGYARPVIVYDDDNLSCNRIISLEQDAYGFIWTLIPQHYYKLNFLST